MASMRRYDEDLRAIGQALEARDISVFDLKRLADNYIIEVEPEETGSVRSKLRHWLHRLLGGSELLTFDVANLEKLSEVGRAKRSKWGQLTNFHTVSNTLRTIGAYLDANEAELVELHKRRITITLSYRDKEGQQHDEDRSISSFYKLFLELLGKRGRPGKTAP